MHRICLLLFCLLLSACASLNGSRTVAISQAQLNVLLEQRLNKSISLLRLVDVALTNPKVTLEPVGNRVMTQLDAAMRNPFSGNQLTGTAKISGRLNMDISTQTIRLLDAKTEAFTLEGLPPQYAAQVNAIGQMLAADFLKELIFYQIQPEDLILNHIKYQPTAFEVRRGQLLITLTPQ